MITNGKCRPDTNTIAHRLRAETTIPVSVLLSPTILENGDLHALKDAGVDKVGVALDLASPELFDRYRGGGVNGPHDWRTYWDTLMKALEVFGPGNVGAHLMIGMGETEKEMVDLMTRLWRLGVANHLFSFFAEDGSRLGERPQPAWDNYLRIQLARYLIEEGQSDYLEMGFDDHGRILNFGLSMGSLNDAIDSGTPFMTTGCLGPDGQVACNRPFGNCLPDVRQWNYPYVPNPEERDLIRQEILKAAG
jgi:biotin synthase